jgi:hypothetical protein
MNWFTDLEYEMLKQDWFKCHFCKEQIKTRSGESVIFTGHHVPGEITYGDFQIELECEKCFMTRKIGE